MWQVSGTIGGTVGAVLLLAGMPGAAEPEARVFEMQEISLLDQDGAGAIKVTPSVRYRPCGTKPLPQVKKYPDLKSNRPLYGSVVFGQVPVYRGSMSPFGSMRSTARTDRGSGTPYYFVIDESEPAESEVSQAGSVVETLTAALAGNRNRSNIRRNYDRLYFDANGDLDLTNDPVVKPAAAPSSLRSSYQEVVFETIGVRFDEKAGLGTGPLEVLPKLRTHPSRSSSFGLGVVSARRGTIELEGAKYTALLTQPVVITGRFDGPYTALALFPTGDPIAGGRMATQQYLAQLRWIQGEFFEISASPEGDRLTVGPYPGDTGLLKVVRRDSGMEHVGLSGMLRSGEMSLRVGDLSRFSQAEKLPEHKIPVGDYNYVSLAVDLGTLQASFSQNYYSMEEPYARLKVLPPALKIRKDESVELDFSGQPIVQFTSPTKGQVFQPGSKIRLRARLIDPNSKLLIRGLYDTTKKISERTYRISGNTVKIPRYAPVAPTVTITNAAGAQVAEGTMPFG